MVNFSPDPEIRLRQKYESNRPFEDSLFVEVDKVQADGFHPQPESKRELPGTSNRPQERGIGQPEQVSAGSEGRQAGGVSLELESAPADICANKHKGAETSIAAHQRIAATSSELRQQIYSFALTSGERGITVKDVVERLKIVINTAAPRLSEMKRDGLLQIKGNERRDGCAVLIPRYAETSI
jgi:hypothetical protein